jgi:drug/metabolite transporter (DMT)-like permease
MIRIPRPYQRLPYLLFAVLLVLDTSSFLLDKLASRHALETGAEGIHFYLTVASQPWIWGGFAIAPFQLLTYTRILKRVDLSLAYPITALAFPFTMLISQLGFGEHLTLPVWCGALLITAGVAVLGHGKPPVPIPPLVAP